MKKLIPLVLLTVLVSACNCSPTDPKYRCNNFGIVEYQKPWTTEWRPMEGKTVLCTPGQPITADSIRE